MNGYGRREDDELYPKNFNESLLYGVKRFVPSCFCGKIHNIKPQMHKGLTKVVPIISFTFGMTSILSLMTTPCLCALNSRLCRCWHELRNIARKVERYSASIRILEVASWVEGNFGQVCFHLCLYPTSCALIHFTF